MRALLPVFAALVLALAGCGGSNPATDAAAADGATTEPLPAPLDAAGAVTGMPDTPGPNEVLIPELPEEFDGPAAAFDESGDPLPPTDAVADAPAAVDPDTAQQAVALVHDYHAAISSGAPGRAYLLWADGGGASGQTAQEFADSFAGVEGVSAEIGTPARAEATTAQVPVTLTVRRLDGSRHRLTGHYVLRRSAEAAASADASAWRIASASLREAGP
jgi:hypothetical protein